MRDAYDEFFELTKDQRAKVLADAETLTDWALELQYNDLLDECNEPVKVCGYEYAPSSALAKLDPVAYRCGFADWIGCNEEIVEIGCQYYSVESVLKAIDSVLGKDQP